MGGAQGSPISATSGRNCPDQGAIEERVELKGMPTGQTSASHNNRGRLSPPLHALCSFVQRPRRNIIVMALIGTCHVPLLGTLYTEIRRLSLNCRRKTLHRAGIELGPS